MLNLNRYAFLEEPINDYIFDLAGKLLSAVSLVGALVNYINIYIATVICHMCPRQKVAAFFSMGLHVTLFIVLLHAETSL